jgi:DNA invertase Pin-like site-specific DNA recombinase
MEALRRVGLTREQVAALTGAKLEQPAKPKKSVSHIVRPDDTAALVRKLHQHGMTTREIVRELRITADTVRRILADK